MEHKEYFKEWAIPGVKPQLETHENFFVQIGETLDALSGHYRIFQLQKGNRFSTDDLLVAWYGSSWCPSARQVLDLGSGIGSVAMIVAWRLQGAQFVTVEAQEQSVELAQKSVFLNELSHRFQIREGDFRDTRLFEPHEKFDLVLGSPPYFPQDSGILGEHPQTVACRFELRGDISDYCKTAAERLERGGFFSCIFPIQPKHQEARVVQAARDAGLVIVRRRSVILKEGDLPLLCLFGMIRSEDLPPGFRDQTWEEPPLVIRKKDGRVHPEYSAIKLSIGFPP